VFTCALCRAGGASSEGGERGGTGQAVAAAHDGVVRALRAHLAVRVQLLRALGAPHCNTTPVNHQVPFIVSLFRF
jgi:hypothetical protein